MTSAERSGDHNEEVSHFLKLYGKDIEIQAIRLTGFYRIDLHELVSRTSVTVWEKWTSELRVLSDDKCYNRTLRIMFNHARNLSKSARRGEVKCDLLPSDELERLTHTITTRQDLVTTEVIFEDERFEIYRAISQLDGQCREVMTLIALGLENSEILQELDMTMTNLTSTKSRARKLLYKILGLRDQGEGGELQ